MPQSPLKEIFSEIGMNEPQISKLKDNFLEKKQAEIFMLRLDEIHPVISGNKIFKLFYFLKEAGESLSKRIITFGGAYSNHLAATAFAGEKLGLKTIGIVRGEKSKNLSHTLLFCSQHGMELRFISHSSYRNIDEIFLKQLKNEYGEYTLIPEGGFSIKGKEGASLINEFFADSNFTHVCLPVGTATTLAGIVDANTNDTEIMGLGVLKNLHDIEKKFSELKVNPKKKYSFIGDYHFGGYAKKNDELISFMSRFYQENKIQLDFVYTAKMMFGVYDLIRQKYFPEGSKILCIHTGGLQGNEGLFFTKNSFGF